MFDGVALIGISPVGFAACHLRVNSYVAPVVTDLGATTAWHPSLVV